MPTPAESSDTRLPQQPEEAAPSLPVPAGARVELAPGIWAPESAVRFQYARSSGPGGQNVNKVNTKAELWVVASSIVGLTDAARTRLQTLAGRRWTAAGEIHIAADTERRQAFNREEVLARLRALLLDAIREPKRRKKTKPTRASKQRRVKGKRMRGEVKARRRGGAGSGDW